MAHDLAHRPSSNSLFPGNRDERDALLQAVRHGCACHDGNQGRRGSGVCAAHALLLDEAALKRLIFYRRWHVALRRGEWLSDPRWSESAE